VIFSRGVERIGCNDNGIGDVKGSNPHYIKSVTRSAKVCGGYVMSMLLSPGGKDL
jgi:hypothetical protein